MSNLTRQRFSLGGLALAAAITVMINGTMLLGFDRLAQSGDNATHGANGTAQLARIGSGANPIVLERVVISARRT